MTVLVPLAALGLQAGSRALAARGGRGSALAVGAVCVAMIVSFLELAIPQPTPLEHQRRPSTRQ